VILAYIVISYMFSIWTELLDIHVGNKITIEYLLFLILYVLFSVIVFIVLNYSNKLALVAISIWNFLSIPSIILMADYNFRFTLSNHAYILTRAVVLIIRVIILFWAIYRLYRLNQQKKML
jgi:hypothetical protein